MPWPARNPLITNSPFFPPLNLVIIALLTHQGEFIKIPDYLKFVEGLVCRCFIFSLLLFFSFLQCIFKPGQSIVTRPFCFYPPFLLWKISIHIYNTPKSQTILYRLLASILPILIPLYIYSLFNFKPKILA